MAIHNNKKIMKNLTTIIVIMSICFFAAFFVGINGIDKRDEIIAKRDGIIDKQFEVIKMQNDIIKLYEELTEAQKQKKYKNAKLIVNNSRQEKIYNYIL